MGRLWKDERAGISLFERVHVTVRERSLIDGDESSIQVKLQVNRDKLIAAPLDSTVGRMYDCDYFYPRTGSPGDLYSSIGLEMVEIVMQGISANCVTLGMAGTGKTHALFGTPSETGLVQDTVKELFRRLEEQSESHENHVSMRYWEMSCDRVMDCLSEEKRCKSMSSCDGDDFTGNKVNIFRDGFGRLYIPSLMEVTVGSYQDFEKLLDKGSEKRIRAGYARMARWHGFVQLSVITTDRPKGERCVLRQMTFVHTKGGERVGKINLRGNLLREGCDINVSLLLLNAGVIHSLEYRQRRMKRIRGQEALHQLIRRSQSFFMSCSFSQMMSQFICGHEASFVVGCVNPLAYADTLETLENLQIFHQFQCACIPVITTSQKGHLLRKLRLLEKRMGGSEVVASLEGAVLSGRPLTEEEENLLHLRGVLEQWDNFNMVGLNHTRFQEQHEEQLKQRCRERLFFSKPFNPVATHGDRKKIYLNAARTATYEGQWVEGLFDGFGEHITPQGKYRGEFRCGKCEGEGTLFHRSNNGESGGDVSYHKVYEGEWLEGKRDGNGTEWCANGDVYAGGFRADQRHGVGKLYLANHERIEGSFRCGLSEGWALLHTANGDWFEGYWSQGMREGPGMWHYVQRQQCLRGEWSKNICVMGVLEDNPQKQPTDPEVATSGLIPSVDLLHYEAILAKERILFNERRSREFACKGLEWVDYAMQPQNVAPTEERSISKETKDLEAASPSYGLNSEEKKKLIEHQIKHVNYLSFTGCNDAA